MEISTDRELEELRTDHRLRAIRDEDEGAGVDDQPGGVYGFTYSPAEENFPLFRKRGLRSYEAHKHADGSIYLVGFLSREELDRVKSSRERITIHLFPEPIGEANLLSVIAMSRVVGHRQYSQRDGKGLELFLNGIG